MAAANKDNSVEHIAQRGRIIGQWEQGVPTREGYFSKTIIDKSYGNNQKVASFFANCTDNRTIIADGNTVPKSQIAIIRDNVLNKRFINLGCP